MARLLYGAVVVGIAMVLAGFVFVYWPLALILGGVAIAAVGFIIDPDPPPVDEGPQPLPPVDEVEVVD